MKLMKDAAESVIETLDCPRLHIGAILGPEFSVVRKVERDTGAKVSIKEKTCNPCKVDITGKRESVDRAKEIVMKLMKDAAESVIEETLDCPFDYSDYVFGASFQGKKRMAKDTGARINVDTKFDPYLVKISGRRECVDRAKEIVVKMMKECEENAQARTPPLTETLDCPKIHIGAIIGLKGSVVRSIEDDTGTKINILDECDPCKVNITGKRECVDRAKEIVMKLMKDAAEQLRLNRGFHAHGREKKSNGDLRRRIQAAPKSSSKSRNSPTKLKKRPRDGKLSEYDKKCQRMKRFGTT